MQALLIELAYSIYRLAFWCIAGRSSGQSHGLFLNLEEMTKLQEMNKHQIRVDLIENSREGEMFAIPDEQLTKVLFKAKAGKRVLVIVNTVKQAQEIFAKLQNRIQSDENFSSLKEKLWLLHSRFTLDDRKNHEENLVPKFSNPRPENESEGKILVATQVVEASLNIDADVLFTEVAPLDALVQRMGRVLRRYGPLTSPQDIPKPTEPNVFVWVFPNELQSGKSYVYDQELILLTLKLLKDKSASQTGQNAKQWLEQKKRSAKSDSTKLIQSVLEEFFENSKSNPSPGFETFFSECDKYELVKRLYESLSEDSRYLTKFRQTKDILDAGYVADRKEEAEKLFREIYTVSIIPTQKREEFVSAACKFFANHKDSKGLYTRFKAEILSKFVVQVPLNLKQLRERELQPVEWWVRDLKCDGDSGSQVDERARRRIVGWCRDIYFARFDYAPEKGLILTSERTASMDAVIL